MGEANMPNFLESMRLRNLFNNAPISGPGIDGVQFPTSGTNPYDVSFGSTGIPSPTGTPMGEPDIAALMQGMNNPTNDASQGFERLIEQYPQRENPSILRRLGSMIVDYTKGPEAGQAMYDQPFQQKLTDWKNKIGPSQQAANLERYENVNTLKERAQAAKEKTDEGKLRISQQRADIANFKAKNPQLKFDFSGPKVKVMDPLTGKISVTEFDTGNLTESDKIDLNQKNAIARIDATGEQARKTEETRQTGREGLAETRGWTPPVNVINPETGQPMAVSVNQITGEVKEIKSNNKNIGAITKPGTSRKEESPQETKIRRYNAADELINTRPDLAKFIELTGTNEFKIAPATSDTHWWSGERIGPTQAQYDEIKNIIYGDGSKSNLMTKTQTNTTTGAKRTLVSADGGKTWQVK